MLATTYNLPSDKAQTEDGLLSRRGDDEDMTPSDKTIDYKVS